MTIDEAIADLFRREINCGCETFFDAGIRLWISDVMNDRRVETQLSRGHFAESGQWLIDAARRLFPEAFVGPGFRERTNVRSTVSIRRGRLERGLDRA